MSNDCRIRNYHNKSRWTEQEIKIFDDNFPTFQKQFTLYTKVLNRSYSSIKSFYHNRQRVEQIQNDSGVRNITSLQNTSNNYSNMQYHEPPKEIQHIFKEEPKPIEQKSKNIDPNKIKMLNQEILKTKEQPQVIPQPIQQQFNKSSTLFPSASMKIETISSDLFRPVSQAQNGNLKLLMSDFSDFLSVRDGDEDNDK
ncbi:Homeobox-like_domain superfamily [Hexamita inflata]|uniref:Homeobox-like domain superfamily n=1 Tax=Hexamita inflata TaxID=28002 RepID=A0AA86PFP3_9EUKA|nr:Homeobox-like domain superfamily [Hexamita inflata]